MYTFLRTILFSFDPELAHQVALKCLQMAYRLRFTSLLFSSKSSKSIEVMGLAFPNRIGLAAGFDKNGEYIDALASLGFGFIEIGTVTPKPQLGNPRPRIFRLVKAEGLINRMGFPNKGIDYVIAQLKKTKYQGILGINIGKNKDTSNENAIDDYLLGCEKFYPFASYLVINISSPNTEGLRALQAEHYLDPLLAKLKAAQKNLAVIHKKYVPLVVKISPDLSEEELSKLANLCLAHHIDGLIATNTTLDRRKVSHTAHANEAGGLSGKPLAEKSNDVIKFLQKILAERIPLIGCGGIADESSATNKINAGAKLLQIYTGLIFNGPGVIKKLISFIK